MKKFTRIYLGLAISLFSSVSFGQATIIRCDPSETGSTMYPNVACDSTGKLQVAITSTVTPSGTQAVAGTAASGAAVSGNPVLVAGANAGLVIPIFVDTQGRPIVTGGTVENTSASASVNSIRVSGWDSSSIVRTLKTDATGILYTSGAVSTFTDRSGTITTGGTSQQLAPVNAARKYLIVQNISTNNLYINFTSAATVGTGSLLIPSNGTYVLEDNFVSSEAVNIIGATTGQAFTAKEK